MAKKYTTQEQISDKKLMDNQNNCYKTRKCPKCGYVVTSIFYYNRWHYTPTDHKGECDLKNKNFN